MGKLFNLLFTLLSIAFFVMLAWITYKAIELRINDKDTAAVEETTNDNTSNVDESSFLSSAKDKMSKATDKAKEIGSNTIDAGKEAVNKMTGKSGIRDEHDPAPKKETVVTPKENNSSSSISTQEGTATTDATTAAAGTTNNKIASVEKAINKSPKKGNITKEVEKKAATSAKKAKDRTVPKSYDQRSSQKKATTTSTSSSSAKGKFWVIAGNFENKQWAKSEVAKFKKLGYKAEIVHFERSNFHTVCVGKYGQKSEANWLVKKLKQKHKVDSYIHKKN